MDEAARLIELLVADEGWSPERHNLLNNISFAELTFCAFKPYINVLDPGGPYKTHTITKEARHLNALYWQIKRQGGKPHLMFKDGTVFHPWKDHKRHVYGPEQIQRHMYDNQVTYYTSGNRGLGLIYMDIDAHKTYQTDEYDGLAVIRGLFPTAYYRASRRGQNQYLKIRYSTPAQFNALCDKVQEKVRLLFLARGVLCDFETKGKITTSGKSGSLAKLPFTTPYPCNRRDGTDCWGCGSLIRFHTAPVYTVEEIETILDGVVIDGDVVVATAEKKRALEATEKKPEQPTSQYVTSEEEPEDEEQAPTLSGVATDTVEHSNSEQPHSEQPSVTDVALGTVEYDEPHIGTADGDAFARNWQVLPGFVRGFYRQHRRFPTTEEALNYLYENGLFSGAWEDGVAGRRNRVASILERIVEGFDESKLGTGEHQELNPRRFDWWVRRHFGSHMRAKVEKRNCFDAETLTYPEKFFDVPLHFVCGFLAAVEIAIAKSENGRVSTNWFKEMFKQMDITWNQDYYRATRDKLHAMGVIQITDRRHKKNVAWTWSRCFNIPASWKQEQRDIKAKLVKGDEEELSFLLPCITVYTNEDAEEVAEVVLKPARPPPGDGDCAGICFDETCFWTICGEGAP